MSLLKKSISQYDSEFPSEWYACVQSFTAFKIWHFPTKNDYGEYTLLNAWVVAINTNERLLTTFVVSKKVMSMPVYHAWAETRR